jgi:pimeloyl-ACP methyl ester carboxylesterase
MLEHGTNPDAIMERYDTPSKRREYILGYHSPSGERVWQEGQPPIRLTSPGGFDTASANFMAEPFDDVESFRASLGFYEGALGFMNAESKLDVEPALIDGTNTVETLVLYGEHDHLHRAAHYPQRMEIACDDLVGPFTIPTSGHFIQFEAAGLFNRTLQVWCRDLLAS